MENLKDKKIAIIGLGTEGIAVAKFLGDNFLTLTLLDQLPEDKIVENCQDNEKKFLKELLSRNNVKKVFSDQYLSDLKSFDVIFRSPGLSFFNPKIQEAKNSGVKITSQIKLFFDLCPAKIIGVTGTKGKGTTASLISEILKKSYQLNFKSQAPNPKVYLAGNIGYPALDLLEKIKSNDIVILELSSFQLMDLEKSPHIAVVTNLTIDHLDYHENEEEYKLAKFNVIAHQSRSDLAILNSDSTFSPEQLKNLDTNIKYFGKNKESDRCIVENNEVILNPKGEKISICNLSDISLLGQHNLENIAAATLVAKELKVDNQTIVETVKKFKGLPHRLEFVRDLRGVKFINDSFATNPDPTMAAIDSFSEDKILILGGSSKGASFNDLAKKIINTNIKAVVIVGEEGKKIEQVLKSAGFSGQFVEGGADMDSIVKNAQSVAKSGDVIILSPACASFGLFKNYKDRGNKFRASVFNLI
jgi:UDP-N-acetylmuramoylalanine--D-glutamate ligase